MGSREGEGRTTSVENGIHVKREQGHLLFALNSVLYSVSAWYCIVYLKIIGNK